MRGGGIIKAGGKRKVKDHFERRGWKVAQDQGVEEAASTHEHDSKTEDPTLRKTIAHGSADAGRG